MSTTIETASTPGVIAKSSLPGANGNRATGPRLKIKIFADGADKGAIKANAEEYPDPGVHDQSHLDAEVGCHRLSFFR